MINNTDNMTPMELMGPDVNASKRLYIEMAIAEAHRQGFTVDVIEFAPDVHPLGVPMEDSFLSHRDLCKAAHPSCARRVD
jgi:hypothetical protein